MLTHQLAKVSLRLDQPLAALALYSEAASRHPGDVGLLLGQARVQEALGHRQEALSLYQQVGRQAGAACNSQFATTQHQTTLLLAM